MSDRTFVFFRDYSNLIARFPIDTTWRVIRLYLASIFTVVIANAGIPIALGFGLTEDSSLYDAFYTTLKILFNIDLSTFIIESDQRSALHAVYAKYRNHHLACS
jgi:energy-coupling factor transporter transmembrane protein EcfT